jgi:hypothetical protein
MVESTKELNQFLGRAALATYAGGGHEVDPKETGFKELEYREGDWFYKDSYSGFFQSWGREIIWNLNNPVWTQIYGGGMAENFQGDSLFARKTFDFLKKVLSAGEKKEEFQPRGPKKFSDGDWEYFCEWSGDITRFQGHEEILFEKKLAFAHDFLGGLIISK